MKKIIPIVLSSALLLGLVGCNSATNQQEATTPTTQETEVTVTETTLKETEPTIEVFETYTLNSSELGEFGRLVTLNATTDMPVDRYLYKLPAGQYRVHITSYYPSSFRVVKDDITIEEGNDEYPEVLDYVQLEEYNNGDCFMLIGTNGNDLNGNAVDEVIFNLNEDESVCLYGSDEGSIYIFELIQPATNSTEVPVIDGQ